MSDYLELIERILAEIKKVVKGKDDMIEKVLTAILAKGHILIEDIPGVGKTTLAMAFSRTLDLHQKRMQFTPDVLPTDVVGFSVLNNKQQFEYMPGAVLCNLFLADEINRTSSKTQSALLEVMEEGRVTVDGKTRHVPKPFIVIATQNPIGSIGTQMLPESQLDRFMIKITMGYPTMEDEIAILKGRQSGNPIELAEKIISADEMIQMQEEVEEVYVNDKVYEYIVSFAAATREHNLIQLGMSPRGTIALTQMAKATAYRKGRDYVIPEDVKAVFPDVIRHRLVLSPKTRMSQMTLESIIEEIQSSVASPKIRSKYAEK